MDWKTILQAQQTDFINRMESGDLFQCDQPGKHSELTVITGDSLQQLRDFCWDMADKYRNKSSSVRKVFVNNMKGKLGEEVVKTRLGDLLTEVDYKQYQGGDGGVDFTLAANSSIGIQVKARQGRFDQIEWSISEKEINKNAVLVCILIQEEVNEAQNQYHLVLAGFLPTNMTTVTGGKARVKINQLLYCGGLRGYLESLTVSPVDETAPNAQFYYKRGVDRSKLGDKQGAIDDFTQAIQIDPNFAQAYHNRGLARYLLGDKQGAIDDYTQAIHIDPNNAYAYNNRGLARYLLGDKQGAIDDYTQAIHINPNLAQAYNNRGNARSDLGDKQGAIDDYTQAIKIDPNDANAYNNRGLARSKLGDNQGGIDDFTQAIQIDPNYALAYRYRGVVRSDLGDKQGAIDDYTQAIHIDPNLAQAYHNRGLARSNLGDKQGAIDDYTQAIKIDPNYANAYYGRGLARSDLGNNQSAIDDFETAANIYKRQGKTEDYQTAMDRIKYLKDDSPS
jgi:tetratricopeptide (TPR) repeat protein